MKYFIVKALLEDKIANYAICSKSVKSAKAYFENGWRNNQLYKNKVVEVKEVDYEVWNSFGSEIQ